MAAKTRAKTKTKTTARTRTKAKAVARAPAVKRGWQPAATIGVIGGSGVYEIAGLKNTKWGRVRTPWGDPSGELLTGRLGDVKLVFVPRHDRGHRLPPSGINYRANIAALKMAGCTDVISVSACGSFREELAPGTFVVVDQFIDRTFAREKSFFEAGLVAHVSMAHPVCGRLGGRLEDAARALAIPVKRGGTYLTMEGPQFSTQAESFMYRQWGCDVIGMTNMPEAKLAREAELCYATVAMVTDYDCWHPGHDHVDVASIIRVLLDNAEKARSLVAHVLPAMADRPRACPQGCNHALDNAIITAPGARDAKLARKLSCVAGRVLG